jgi:predicted kinase
MRVSSGRSSNISDGRRPRLERVFSLRASERRLAAGLRRVRTSEREVTVTLPVEQIARRLLLLRGAPGVGKSTCASLLGEWNVARCVIEVDRFRRFVPAVDWHDQHLHSLARDTATDTACTFANGGFSPVLLVDCFGRDHATRAMQRASAAGVQAKLVSLWAEPAALQRRLPGKPGRRDADYAMAFAINDEIRAHHLGGTLIDTSRLDIETVARCVHSEMGAEW